MGGYHEFESPFRGTVKDLPVLIIGILGDTRFFCIDTDGMAKDIPIEQVRIDVRYDFSSKSWEDVTDKAD